MIWNGILLALGISLILNILFIWYLRQLLSRFAYICTNIFELKSTIDLYVKHLRVVSELEMFYKDPNIEQLMQHTADLVKQFETYEEFYTLISSNDIANIPDQIEGIEKDDDSEEDSQEAEKKENEVKEIK